MTNFPNKSCMTCKFIAKQPAGYSCSGFTYIKIEGKIVADTRKEEKPKGCPLKECK